MCYSCLCVTVITFERKTAQYLLQGHCEKEGKSITNSMLRMIIIVEDNVKFIQTEDLIQNDIAID